MIKLSINGETVEVEKGSTILEAAAKLNINIPTLCHMYMGNDGTRNCKGTCRVCLVEQEGRSTLIPSCSVEASDGMVIKTNSPRVVNARRKMVELILSDHPQDCLNCKKNTHCELQKLAADLGIVRVNYEGGMSKYPVDNSTKVIVRDMDKCIRCRRCVTMCNDVQKVHALTMVDRGFESVVSTFFNKDLKDTDCTYCGQCVAVCPTGALVVSRDYDKVWDVLNDKEKYVVVQTAPAVRVGLGEDFGLEPGSVTTGKMVAALKKLGFSAVFDTNFAADLTIMEEATEFIDRFTNNKDLPLITSCCPAWVNFAENTYSELLNHVSSCKSPQQMFGAVAKTYLAKQLNIDPKNIVVISIMPCTAKKNEATKDGMGRDGIQDVDMVITTREFSKMVKEAGIDLVNIPDQEYDSLLGESTGAGNLFGATGGVMEAALRTSYEWVTGNELKDVEFKEVRGLKGIKEATIELSGKEVNVAVASSLGNARKIMDDIKDGNSKYDFIEIMACPGGCINGAGQPFSKANFNIIEKRMDGIYSTDADKTLRKAHENPMIKKLYSEFLDKPNGELAHKLLHTKFRTK